MLLKFWPVFPIKRARSWGNEVFESRYTIAVPPLRGKRQVVPRQVISPEGSQLRPNSRASVWIRGRILRLPDNWRNIAITLIMALRWALECKGLVSTVSSG
jgi:hypothetical protein